MKIRTIFLMAGAGLLLAGGTAVPVLRAQQQRAADAFFSGSDMASRRLLAGLILRRVAARLHVTPDQKTAALAALRSYQPAIKPLVDQLIKERFALRKQLEAPTVDETAGRAGAQRMATIEADLAVQKAHLFHDLRAVATPEQLASVDQMEANAETRSLEFVDLVSRWITQS